MTSPGIVLAAVRMEHYGGGFIRSVFSLSGPAIVRVRTPGMYPWADLVVFVRPISIGLVDVRGLPEAMAPGDAGLIVAGAMAGAEYGTRWRRVRDDDGVAYVPETSLWPSVRWDDRSRMWFLRESAPAPNSWRSP